MIEERSSFALLVGTVVDVTTVALPYTPQPPRSPLSVAFEGIGTPPTPTDLIWAQTFSNGGFVLAFEAGSVAIDNASSSGPSPKHLTGAFDIHFTVSAQGYADLALVYSCNHDALPIVPAAYSLQPSPLYVRGTVTASGAPLAGAAVQITAESPAPGPLPPATATDANGMYAFDGVAAAQTITIAVSGGGHSGSQTVPVGYPDPVTTVNFPF